MAPEIPSPPSPPDLLSLLRHLALTNPAARMAWEAVGRECRRQGWGYLVGEGCPVEMGSAVKVEGES